jgi:hypothetical protein
VASKQLRVLDHRFRVPADTPFFDSLSRRLGLHLDPRGLQLDQFQRVVHSPFQHPPGDDQYGYEDSGERWLPVHTVESIVSFLGYFTVHRPELTFDSVVERHLSLVL